MAEIPRRLRSRRAGLVLACALGLSVAVWYALPGPPPSPSSATTADPLPVGGDFTLTAHDGRVVSVASFRGKWLLVYFGFTHCIDRCPITIARIVAALDRLGPLAAGVQSLFISVDPQRDTPAVLASFLTTSDQRILGLTGTGQEVAAAAAAYRVAYPNKFDADATPHTDIIYVMDPQGRFSTHVSHDVDADRLAGRLRQLMSGRLP